MSFTVEVDVPDVLYWDTLTRPINDSLRKVNVEDKMRATVIRHYAYVLRLKSWEHGIDWNPQRNKIVVEVPNKHASKESMDEGAIVRDGLSSIIQEIIKDTPLHHIMSHFKDASLPVSVSK